MATYSKVIISGSTSGRGIEVAATSTPGTTLHTAHATDTDELYLWAVCDDTTDTLLTVEFGGTTDPDDLMEQTIYAQQGLQMVVPGLPITGGLAVAAFAASAARITVFGFVNRIT